MDSESLEESFMKALPPMSSGYQQNALQDQLAVSVPVIDRDKTEEPEDVKVPQGLVKGYGGAIEKSIAAHAANVMPKSRGFAPKLTKILKQQEQDKNTAESEGDRTSKSSDDTTSLAGLDRVLVHSWFMALMRNETETVKRMAKAEPKLVLMKDFIAGHTAVHWAVHHGNDELLIFICQNFDVNKTARTRAGYTPLHIAYIRNKPKLADILLQFEFDPEERDYSGRTPSFYFATTVNSGDLHTGGRTSSGGQKKTISKAFNHGLRRIGSLNAKFRSSMMRPRPAGLSFVKESKSSPIPFLENRDIDLMPPPVTVPKARSRIGSDLFRRGSQASDLSRSDSVISFDDTKSSSQGKPAFDSGSDTASFQESESMDSFLQRSDNSVSSPLAGLAKGKEGKTASPLIYTKNLNYFDDGSQV